MFLSKTEKRLLDALENSSTGSIGAEGTREVAAARKLIAKGLIKGTPAGNTYITKDRKGNSVKKYRTMMVISLKKD